jgi:MFS family permease
MSDEMNLPMPKKELYWVFGALMLGMLLAALDSTIVATALPTIVGDLHGANHLSWVVVAYLLATTVSTPLWGKLGDLHGRKMYFQAAIVIFLIGSMLCGAAHSMAELILFRALQGLGGGGLMVGAQAIIADLVPPRERGRYAGFFGATFGAATVLGPLLGGVIVEYWSWRWIFFVNVPFGILALVVCAAKLPGSAQRASHVIDYAGILLLTISASALILFTSLGGTTFSWASTKSIGLLVVGLVTGVAFAFAERRSPEPVLAPRLFRNVWRNDLLAVVLPTGARRVANNVGNSPTAHDGWSLGGVDRHRSTRVEGMEISPLPNFWYGDHDHWPGAARDARRFDAVVDNEFLHSHFGCGNWSRHASLGDGSTECGRPRRPRSRDRGCQLLSFDRWIVWYGRLWRPLRQRLATPVGHGTREPHLYGKVALTIAVECVDA